MILTKLDINFHTTKFSSRLRWGIGTNIATLIVDYTQLLRYDVAIWIWNLLLLSR